MAYYNTMVPADPASLSPQYYIHIMLIDAHHIRAVKHSNWKIYIVILQHWKAIHSNTNHGVDATHLLHMSFQKVRMIYYKFIQVSTVMDSYLLKATVFCLLKLYICGTIRLFLDTSLSYYNNYYTCEFVRSAIKLD